MFQLSKECIQNFDNTEEKDAEQDDDPFDFDSNNKEEASLVDCNPKDCFKPELFKKFYC